MIPPLPSLLVLAVLQDSPALESSAACEDSRRIDLALTPTAEAREICVSPGMMTGFLFDTIPLSLELEGDARFVEVLRGPRGISFVPPKDMMSGERLRLTARLETGAPQEIITFILVAHRGQATRQVEVYRNSRPRESYQREAEEERAKNQRLRQQNQHLLAQLERAQGLRKIIASKIVGSSGVQALTFQVDAADLPAGVVLHKTVSYRADKTVVAEVELLNSSAAPWKTLRVSLVDANGEAMQGVQFLQEDVIPPNGKGQVFLEAEADRKQAQGTFKLMLWDENSRLITIPGVRFP